VIAVWTEDQEALVRMGILVYQDWQDGKETPEDRDFRDWMVDQALQVRITINGLIRTKLIYTVHYNFKTLLVSIEADNTKTLHYLRFDLFVSFIIYTKHERDIFKLELEPVVPFAHGHNGQSDTDRYVMLVRGNHRGNEAQVKERTI